MTNTEILIELIHSLGKNEKRSFKLGKKGNEDYIMLFDLIDKDTTRDADLLKEAFEKRSQGSVFSVTVTYLLKLILDKLVSIKHNTDVNYALLSQIMNSRILFERSIFPAALDTLDKVKLQAERLERNEVLILALRQELDYLQYLRMPGISEEELINKQYTLLKTLGQMKNLYEQSSLYELLIHRTTYKGAARSADEKETLNDLVFREYTLAHKASQSVETRQRHFLFQSEYFMATGDEQSASDVLLQLNTLINENPEGTNPLFYVNVFESMLENMRQMGNYSRMNAIIDKLLSLTHPSHMVSLHIEALAALYRMLLMLDQGDFKKTKEFYDKCKALQPLALEKLNPSMESKISLYVALMYLGLDDYKHARKSLVGPIINKTCDLPMHRILRIVGLIVHHKMNDVDYILCETRSLKREIAKSSTAYRLESLILEVIGKGSYSHMHSDKRQQLWQAINSRLQDIRQDVFETQLLKIFDFSAWIESEVLHTSLADCLKRNLHQRMQDL